MKIQTSICILSACVALAGCNSASDGTDSGDSATNATSSEPAAAATTAEAATGSTAAATAPATGDWKTTDSGLKYQVLKSGNGTQSPKATDHVRVHYHGTFLNGTVFDSSVQRNEPASFPLNGVIAGWTEGVQLMKVGDKFKFEIPPNLAYGPAGRPGIPPNSTLVFEVELLGIE